MWWEVLSTLLALETIPVGTLVPGGFNRAGQVLGERQGKLQRLARSGGWAISLCPIPLLTNIITESRHIVVADEKCSGHMRSAKRQGS